MIFSFSVFIYRESFKILHELTELVEISE